MIDILARIGRPTLAFFAAIGRILLFSAQVVRHGVKPPYASRQFFRQCIELGFYSLPVIALTAIFSGMVLALQTHVGFARYASERVVPSVVAVSITRELGPVMAGLMLAGRVGAAIAAEIGTMRVTEQIDALHAMSVHPLRFLIMPRIMAGLVMLPLLVAIGSTLGIMGGYLVSVNRLDVNATLYLRETIAIVQWQDISLGLTKAAIFGVLTTLLGSYFGYFARAGASGVGEATTRAVVASSASILISNYFITEFFFRA